MTRYRVTVSRPSYRTRGAEAEVEGGVEDVALALAACLRELGVNVKVARAEQLPFKEGWFERAVLWLVAHLVDRPAVFAELSRVLAADGRSGPPSAARFGAVGAPGQATATVALSTSDRIRSGR